MTVAPPEISPSVDLNYPRGPEPLRPARVAAGSDSALALARCRLAWFAGYGKSFRGSITDYARTIWLGSGYLGDWSKTNLCKNCAVGHPVGSPEHSALVASGKLCRHFEIDTARHLAGPFRAIQDPNVRVVMILKAAQTAGSLVWDLTVHWLLVHSPFMRVKVLMDSDEKARTYCTQRLMETLRANPEIAPLLPTGADRFAVTDTEMRLLNGKTLFVGGLNERNASSLPADVMILDEGWLHQSDGLMKKAFFRLKQSKSAGKMIIVGQAGMADEDQDKIWKGLAKRVPLTWACPCCGGRQEFSLPKLRPEIFVPLPPRPDFLPAGELWLPPVAGTNYGFSIPTKLAELMGPEAIRAAAEATTIECYHCGYKIADTPAMRSALNASYEQDYQETASDGTKFTPPDFEVGFWNPDPASVNVKLAATVREYIIAKKSHDESAQTGEIENFYKNNWATAFEEKMLLVRVKSVAASIDPLVTIPDELFRTLDIDCQKDRQLSAIKGQDMTGHFWATAWATDKRGNDVQLWRGYCTSWEEWINKGKELKIPTMNVSVDIGFVPDEVKAMAARHAAKACRKCAHEYAAEKPVCQCHAPGIWTTWTMMRGSDNHSFRWEDGVSREYKIERPEEATIYGENGAADRVLTINVITWSNFRIKSILYSQISRQSGQPGYTRLPDDSAVLSDRTRAMEKTLNCSWDDQINSQLPGMNRTGKRAEFVAVHKENHYPDTWCQHIVRKIQAGVLGRREISEQTAQPTQE